MKKFLNLKIIIPAVVVLLMLGTAGYILFAPSTWWKPVYIRFEGDEATASAEEGQSQAETATTPAAMMPSGVPMPPSAAMPGGAAAQTPPMLAFLNGQSNPGIMYNLDKKVVNLAEPGGLRYLQTSVVLEFWPLIEDYYNLEEAERLTAEEEFKADIAVWDPIINDLIMSHLSSKAYQEIASIDGKQTLKEELMAAINDKLGYQGVINIYFTDFVIQ